MSPKKALIGGPLFMALLLFFLLNAGLVYVIYYLWKKNG